jgi:hypothetical protein
MSAQNITKFLDLSGLAMLAERNAAIATEIDTQELAGYRLRNSELRTVNLGASVVDVIKLDFAVPGQLSPGQGDAANISITDAGGHLAATTVEAALAELGVTRPRIAKLRLQAGVNVTAAAMTQTLDLAPVLPADALVMGAWAQITTPFSGGGSSNCTVKVGDAGDDDRLITSSSIFTGASGRVIAAGVGLNGAASPHCYASSTTTKVIIASDVNVSLLSAGDVTVYVAYASLNGDPA